MSIDDLPLSPKTRKRLAAAAKSVERTEAEVAAAVLEATFEADDHEVERTRQSVLETARRRGIGLLPAIRQTLAGTPLAAIT